MKNLEQILQDKQATTEEALQAFDALDAVSTDFMKGRWQGMEIMTGHPLDGLLEMSGWYGKMFIDENHIHPLLFYSRDKKGLFSVDPRHIPLGTHVVKLKKLAALAPVVMKLLRTTKSTACLRMLKFRGKETATMIYNDKPMRDYFGKMDDNRVLGVMELKDVPQPYFFVLIRDDQSTYKITI